MAINNLHEDIHSGNINFRHWILDAHNWIMNTHNTLWVGGGGAAMQGPFKIQYQHVNFLVQYTIWKSKPRVSSYPVPCNAWYAGSNFMD